MNLLSRDELNSLIGEKGSPSVSLFLPTHRMTTDTQQDPTMLKNLLKKAEEQLLRNGQRPADVTPLLGPARELVKDTLFWQHQSDGLAVFVCPGTFRFYRLPLSFDPLVMVGKGFYVKPLVRLFTGGGRYFVLAVSQNHVRLLDCTPHSVKEVELKGVPGGLADVLKFNEEQKSLDLHGSPAAGPSRKVATFGGHGGGRDERRHKKEILGYFKEIDKGLHALLRNERAPLVFVGVDYLRPLYREVNTYPHLLTDGVLGNPDRQTIQQLHEHTMTVVAPYFRNDLLDAVNRYQRAVGAGKASTNIKSIVRAAHGGKVSTLFVTARRQLWGHFDPETQGVHLREKPGTGDEDLLNFAAVHTLLHRGTVYTQDPEEKVLDEDVAAVLRY